jgi:hypothetical protein
VLSDVMLLLVVVAEAEELVAVQQQPREEEDPMPLLFLHLCQPFSTTAQRCASSQADHMSTLWEARCVLWWKAVGISG